MTLRRRPAQCALVQSQQFATNFNKPWVFNLTCVMLVILYRKARRRCHVGTLDPELRGGLAKVSKATLATSQQFPSLATCGIWSPSRKSTVTIKRTHFQPYLWRSVQRRLWFISNSERDAWIVVRNRLWHRSTGPVKAKSGFGPTILPSTGNHFPAKNQTFWV